MRKRKLDVGSLGEHVKDLHRKLVKHGFGIPSRELDRVFFGPGTRSAIVQCQRNLGLPITGIVDEFTNAKLEAAPQSSPIQSARTGPPPGLDAVARSAPFPPRSSGSIAPPGTAVPHTSPTEIFAREIA